MLRRTSETQTAGWGADRPPAKASITSQSSEGDLRELIAIRAYELYVERGSTQGDETTDWLRAEAEVLNCLQTRPLDPQPSARRSRNGAKKAAPKVTAPRGARRALAATSTRKNKPRSEAA